MIVDESGRLVLSYGGWEYFDRTTWLLAGRVRPRGVVLNYQELSRAELGWHLVQNGEFDAGEFWAASFITMSAAGESRYVGIPVFPSRMFRHGSVFVRQGSSLERLEELKGARIAVGDYNVTAVVWMRGIMEDEAGVTPDTITWFVNRVSVHAKVGCPEGVRIIEVDSGTPEELLLAGEVDAVIIPNRPASLGQESGVRRLLRNHQAVEEDYYRRTGVFPIMHVVAIRRDIYEANPWIAASLLSAFHEAKRLGFQRLNDTSGPAVGLAWLGEALEAQGAVLGDDPFAYGFANNRHTVQVLCDYVYRQGLAKRRVDAEELFAEETLGLEPGGGRALF